MKIFLISFYIILLVFPFLTSSARFLYATTTRTWIETDRSDFAKGKLENVSVHDRGKLTLSPNKLRIKEVPAAYVWCLAKNEAGLIFAGTGDPGSIFKITQNGDVTEFYKTPELHVKTIATDNTGNIYAGTLPHGRIYKITSDGKGGIFCELPDPYIWDLVFDSNGNLYAATGNNGIIYKISEEGIPSVFFDSPYSNILDLAIDEENNTYAACEPEGLIYKITTNGNASVLYDTEESEVHCLAIDKNGILYAGTSSGIPPVLPIITPPTPPQIQLPLPIEELPYEANDILLNDLFPNTNMDNSKHPAEDYIKDEFRERPVPAERNSVYRIDKDGRVKEILVVEKAFILCLTVNSNNDVLVGTGNKAKLFKIVNGNVEDTSLLYDFYESQVLDILPYKDGYKYIATGNNANVYQLSSDYSSKGTYESGVHDTSYISSWGCISWEGKTPSQTEIRLSTRSGNSKKPDSTWSDWSEEYERSGEKTKSPPARFIQYRVTLTTNDSITAPILDNASIAYLPQNQPPLIKSITISSPRDSSREKTDANNNSKIYKTPSYPKKNESNFGLSIHEPKKLINWEASDPNNDRLRFDLEYKGIEENKWNELRRNIKEEKIYHWNTNRIPDGYYQVKVIASDVLDNPMELALKEEKASNAFLVDNTRPIISDLKTIMEADPSERLGRAGRARNTLIISGIARDEMCNITEIQYSVDSGDWNPVFPADKIFDSKEESFLLKIPYVSSEEHAIVINAIDAEGNVGSSRIVFNP
ncbi:MAG: hypothetical protein ACE5GU_03475 [Candidatus Scalinduaceae bacterium]